MPLVGIGTPPTPHPQASVPPSPLFLGGGEHSLARKGVGESQFRRRAYTVVLFICTYFVPLTFSGSHSASLLVMILTVLQSHLLILTVLPHTLIILTVLHHLFSF